MERTKRGLSYIRTSTLGGSQDTLRKTAFEELYNDKVVNILAKIRAKQHVKQQRKELTDNSQTMLPTDRNDESQVFRYYCHRFSEQKQMPTAGVRLMPINSTRIIAEKYGKEMEPYAPYFQPRSRRLDEARQHTYSMPKLRVNSSPNRFQEKFRKPMSPVHLLPRPETNIVVRHKGRSVLAKTASAVQLSVSGSKCSKTRNLL